MHFTADRSGTVTEENSLQDRFLAKLYHSVIGRILLKPLISPAFSKIGGIFLDSFISRILIPPFIRSHSISLKEYESRRYRSFNDFFKRKLLYGARKIDRAKDAFISPCDSRLSVYKINGKNIFSIKHTQYTVASLLRSQKLAQKYTGGYLWIFRLRADDYHHYIYTDEGKVSKNHKIPGVFHTVNPVASDLYPIYKENTREYALLKSKNFGAVLQMEVGALLVGKIENRPGGHTVRKGQEKGCFAFGGSTIILMTQEGRVLPDEDILKNSAKGIETSVRLGERVGRKGDV